MNHAEADALYETPLPPEEFDRRVQAAILALDGEEGDEVRAHIAWFCRRYPTPLARLAYARRKCQEAMASRGAALGRR